MFAFVIAVVLLLGGFIVSTVMRRTPELNSEIQRQETDLASDQIGEYKKDGIRRDLQHNKKLVKRARQVSLVTLVACLVLSAVCFVASVLAVVPTGYTGIKTTFGKVENDTMPSGPNFILPWQSVVLMDNRTQKAQLDTQAFSSDIQQVDVRMSINYNIDQQTAQILYKTVGVGYFDNVMYPRIQENTKAVFSQYTAESLIEHRNELSAQILQETAKDMAQYGINIVSISIENIDFTDAFTDAVEAKQVAAQRKLTAETEQAQKTMEEQAAAERAIIAENARAEQAKIAASADLEVVKIQAEASLYAGQKEAEMNQRIAESLTPNLIHYYLIKQWSGELPDTMLGNDSNILLTLGE